MQAVWQRLTKNFSREGSAPWVSGFLFKAVVQSVLLFIAETWVVTPRMGRVLGERFQYHVAQQLTGRIPRRHTDRKWEYTSVAAAREEAVFETIEEYIWRMQNSFAQFIAKQSLTDLCEETERTPGARVGMRWWEKAGLDLEGAKETAVTEADGMKK